METAIVSLLLHSVLGTSQINTFDKAKAVHMNLMGKYKNISSVPEQFLDERHQFTIFPILSCVEKLMISIIIHKFHISFYLQENASNWR